MRPEFPTFKPLGPEDRELLAEHLARTPHTICDLSLANLYIWHDCEPPSLTFIHGNLCILIESHSEPRYFLEPLGDNEFLETIDVCLNHAGRVSRVQESTALRVPASRFHKVPLREHFDYVYEVQSLAALKGKKFDGKRNRIKKFARNHPGYEFLPLRKDHLEQALALFDRWSREREIFNGEESSSLAATYECQRRALEAAFLQFDPLNLLGGAILVAGQMEGFILASSDGTATATAHLQYANYRMSGIYQVLLWETCCSIFKGFTYLNLEEDLGLPGLRKTKLSYQPLRLEQKFLITRD
jgi:uncharacterized protein